MTAALHGGCLCGAVRYQAGGAPFHQTVCHCADCRRATGAPMVGWFTVRPGDLVFTAAEPRRRQSSPGVTRSFCPGCGTPLTFQDRAEEVDVTICTLDDPDALPPRDHTRTLGQLAWVRLADGLPRHPRLRGDSP